MDNNTRTWGKPTLMQRRQQNITVINMVISV
jgi:hypothetical protein